MGNSDRRDLVSARHCSETLEGAVPYNPKIQKHFIIVNATRLGSLVRYTLM